MATKTNKYNNTRNKVIINMRQGINCEQKPKKHVATYCYIHDTIITLVVVIYILGVVIIHTLVVPSALLHRCRSNLHPLVAIQRLQTIAPSETVMNDSADDLMPSADTNMVVDDTVAETDLPTSKKKLQTLATLHAPAQSVEAALEHLTKADAELSKLDQSHIQPLITLIKSIELPSHAQNQIRNQSNHKNQKQKEIREALNGNANESAKLYASVAYALQTLYFIYLRTSGVSPDDHPVKQELERIRKMVESLGKVATSGASSASSNVSK